MQEHAANVFAQVEDASGVGLPKFVRDEFEALLEWGILAHGFLRLSCADCAHDKLVAFSCKRRGFCQSCGARRMAETAAHLVDHVIPTVPVRQWVLSLPIGLRILLAAQPQLLTPVLQVVQRVFHLHSLVLDGVYRLNSAGELWGAVKPRGCAAPEQGEPPEQRELKAERSQKKVTPELSDESSARVRASAGRVSNRRHKRARQECLSRGWRERIEAKAFKSQAQPHAKCHGFSSPKWLFTAIE